MTKNSSEAGGGLVPVARSVPAVADSTEMRDWAEQLVARARSEGVELTGDNGLLTAMVRQLLQTGLNVELAEHLGELNNPAALIGGEVREVGHRLGVAHRHASGSGRDPTQIGTDALGQVRGIVRFAAASVTRGRLVRGEGVDSIVSPRVE